ncbi:MAG: hypothetical protein AB7I19_02075 [Planctomycetota bacterium]
MNQLDIPPISFARYVNLLKRRRWQVIPMSIAGLVVGAIVAWFIPRYYVAKTTITYKGGALDPKSRTPQDPLYAKVTNAKLTIRHALETTLERLTLIGTNINDPERPKIIARYEDRITVNTYAFDQDRGYYNIDLSVKDTDGERSALLANTLRRDWIASVTDDLEREARVASEDANRELRVINDALANLQKRIQQYQEQYQIDPTVDEEKWRFEESDSIGRRRRDLDDRISDVSIDLEEARREYDIVREQLATIPQTKPRAQVQIALDPETANSIRELKGQLKYHRVALETLKDSAQRRSVQSTVETIERQIVELETGALGTDVGEDVPNPEYEARLKERQDLEKRIASLELRQSTLKRERTDLDQKLLVLQKVYTEYAVLVDDRDLYRTRREAAELAVKTQSDRFESARRGNPFGEIDAVIPPTPTEPGFLLVAFAGCIVGLGAAIGFVLLADFVRSTFKTVDDVAYALSVPVLGVMAHLETAEQRARVVRQRRRITLVAATFVVLNLSLVTVYYISPSRLPVWIVTTLDRVLGNEAGAPTSGPR